MDRKQELLKIEEERWDGFLALLSRVPDERMDDSTLNADGWSVKDLLWHMRCWDEEVARELAEVRSGTYEDLSDWEADRKNAEFLEEGRRTDLGRARHEAQASRARAVEQMRAIPQVTPVVEEWFSESAWRHIDDHEPELRAFVERLDADA